MDLDPSATETTFHVSNQSGSIPSSYSPENSDIEFSTEKHVMDSAGVDHNNNTSSSVNGGSENEGFVSGDEEFQTAPERPIRVYPDEKSVEEDVVHTPFVNASEFFTPKSERPIANVWVGADLEDEYGVGDSEVDILRGTKLEQGADGNLEIATEGSVEKLGIGAASLEYKEDLVQMESTEYLNFSEVVKESGFTDGREEFGEASGGGDKGFESGKLKGSMHTVYEGGMPAEDNRTELYNLKDEQDVKQQNGDNLHDRQLAAAGGAEVNIGDNTMTVGTDISNTGHADFLTVESAYDKLIENDDIKFTSTGDLVVDTLHVNLLGSGAAVDGDKEEIKETEMRGMEAPARSVSLDNGFNPIVHDADEPFDNSETGDAKSNQIVDAVADDDIEHAEKELNGQKLDIASQEKDENLEFESHDIGMEVKDKQRDINIEAHVNVEENGSLEASGESLTSKCVDPNSSSSLLTGSDENHVEKDHRVQGDGSVSDGEAKNMTFGSSGTLQRFSKEMEMHSSSGSRSGGESSQDPSQRIDGHIATDSDEVDTDEEGERKELFDPAALAALLKAARGAGQDGGSITITSQDGSRLFSVERPAGLGPSLQSIKPASWPNRANHFTPSNLRESADSESNLSEEEKKKLEKLQQIRIKFLRLVQRLGFTPEESIAAQVLYRMTLVAGRRSSQLLNLDAAKRSASQLETEGRDDLNFSLNILVLGKTGVGKSATLNSIFSERKTTIDAYGPATTAVREIVGTVDGVKIRAFDTPGLKSSAVEQSFNRKILSMVKKFTKNTPPDIVLYVDRLDAQTRDLNDLPLLRSITSALGPSIWRNAIVALTHAASAPPDGPSGSPLSYDVFVAQRSHVVQQIIGQALGDLRLMNPSLMNPVSLVENHPSCRKNRDGQKVLPNGQSWRPQLLLLCYSMKILSEIGNLSKTQDPFDHQRLFGFRVRSPPLPYLLSWLLQSRTHPKLSADQSGDNGDSDVELADLSDSDLEEDEYDQLPPFKPLRKSQIAKLSREQQKAYFEEYDYRVKLLQKKQWREELKRMREMKKKGKTNVNDYNYIEEDDQENGSPTSIPVPLPDMVLPQSFDSDNPAYRYRFLEPTSQFLARPVLDTHGWDHDCGYDGVNIEHSLAIINQFPAAVTVQVTKDKKDFSIHLDSSIATKHGENASTMAGFDIQNIGKQLAYILRGETKLKKFKKNKTAAGFSMTFLGENVSTGLKVEDQIALGKRMVIVGSTGTVRSQGDSAYGANIEVQLREADFPIGQDQSSFGLSLVKWKGDLALGANFQSQFSIGRSYKMAVRAGLNNKLSGQITVRTSSTDQLQIALLAILPIAKAIYKNFWPGSSENYSIY